VNVETDSRTYVVALRGPSWFALEQGDSLAILSKSSVGPITITIRTRYKVIQGTPVRRELLADISGKAPDIASAINDFWNSARGAMGPLALAANAAIGELVFDVAYDVTPDALEHDFFQNYILPESGIPKSTRRVESKHLANLLEAIEHQPDASRISRAAEQYRHALLYWSPGQETFAVMHLWMCIEALTPAALREIYRRQNLTKEDLVKEWKIDIKQLDGEVRRRLIFKNNTAVYKAAKRASDAFEHGFEDFQSILKRAAAVRDDIAHYVREFIFELISFDPQSKAVLEEDKYVTPLDPQSRAYYLQGTLVGSSTQLAAEDQAHPRLIWNELLLKNLTPDDKGGYEVQIENKGIALFGKGVMLRDLRYMVRRTNSHSS
jgi:hypothetical protein